MFFVIEAGSRRVFTEAFDAVLSGSSDTVHKIRDARPVM